MVALPVGITGVPTGGCTTTVVDTAEDVPPQPVAITLTVAVPVNPLANDTDPVEPVPLMEPALEGDNDHVYPVALDAVVVYVAVLP